MNLVDLLESIAQITASSLFPVSRFIKYTGYGNAAGLLAARGLFRGSKVSGVYSEDEDSDTEEYKEAKSQSVPTAEQPSASFFVSLYLNTFFTVNETIYLLTILQK